tara:strand:- start:62 stop:331 length:270 start_codon:yes stop_codon:yes gene_type:complete
MDMTPAVSAAGTRLSLLHFVSMTTLKQAVATGLFIWDSQQSAERSTNSVTLKVRHIPSASGRTRQRVIPSRAHFDGASTKQRELVFVGG